MMPFSPLLFAIVTHPLLVMLLRLNATNDDVWVYTNSIWRTTGNWSFGKQIVHVSFGPLMSCLIFFIRARSHVLSNALWYLHYILPSRDLFVNNARLAYCCLLYYSFLISDVILRLNVTNDDIVGLYLLSGGTTGNWSFGKWIFHVSTSITWESWEGDECLGLICSIIQITY